jgi:hypothetical protein
MHWIENRKRVPAVHRTVIEAHVDQPVRPMRIIAPEEGGNLANNATPLPRAHTHRKIRPLSLGKNSQSTRVDVEAIWEILSDIANRNGPFQVDK